MAVKTAQAPASSLASTTSSAAAPQQGTASSQMQMSSSAPTSAPSQPPTAAFKTQSSSPTSKIPTSSPVSSPQPPNTQPSTISPAPATAPGDPIKKVSKKIEWTTVVISMAGLVVAAVMIWFAVQTRNHEFHERCLADHDHNITMQEGCPKELNGISRRQIEAARHGVLSRAYTVLRQYNSYVCGSVIGASVFIQWAMLGSPLVPLLYLTGFVPVSLMYIIMVVYSSFILILDASICITIYAVLVCMVYLALGRIRIEEIVLRVFYGQVFLLLFAGIWGLVMSLCAAHVASRQVNRLKMWMVSNMTKVEQAYQRTGRRST